MTEKLQEGMGQMMKKTGFLTGLLLSVFLCGFAARADVVINEVMASNGFYENGQAYDWEPA